MTTRRRALLTIAALAVAGVAAVTGNPWHGSPGPSVAHTDGHSWSGRASHTDGHDWIGSVAHTDGHSWGQ